ncbi:MAG TPA: hypothetical protein VG455_14365, partial [Acidimicrobiales bacterium]|nr:hypothetical protein [Acidimicrobiales bacterium]
MNILFLCTGNICRSPVAEVLLRQRLADLGVPARVRSAGLLRAGQPASEIGQDLLRGRGFDLSNHRSRTVTREILLGADLVLAMAREHVREAVVAAPEAWPHTFTLKELVRRGEELGPRREGEPFAAWLERLGAGRATSDLMGTSPGDDIADPLAKPRSAYEALIAELEDLLDRFVLLGWGHEQTAPAGPSPAAADEGRRTGAPAPAAAPA